MIFLCVERHLFGKELEKMQDHVKLTDDSLLLISEDFSPVFGMKMNRHVTHTHTHKVALESENFVQTWDGSVFFSGVGWPMIFHSFCGAEKSLIAPVE